MQCYVVEQYSWYEGGSKITVHFLEHTAMNEINLLITNKKQWKKEDGSAHFDKWNNQERQETIKLWYLS